MNTSSLATSTKNLHLLNGILDGLLSGLVDSLHGGLLGRNHGGPLARALGLVEEKEEELGQTDGALCKRHVDHGL